VTSTSTIISTETILLTAQATDLADPVGLVARADLEALAELADLVGSVARAESVARADLEALAELADLVNQAALAGSVGPVGLAGLVDLVNQADLAELVGSVDLVNLSGSTDRSIEEMPLTRIKGRLISSVAGLNNSPHAGLVIGRLPELVPVAELEPVAPDEEVGSPLVRREERRLAPVVVELALDHPRARLRVVAGTV
jgi:hypothetical protein